jgi:hypothetical protein
VIPVEASSGIDRDGRPRPSRRWVMSKRGNDLVRRYLWMAALSAVQCNPAVRALYHRVAAKNPKEKAVAIGHAMRKLLHLVFAVWNTDKPFDPKHHPWEGPAEGDATTAATPGGEKVEEQAAGHKPDTKPAEQVVTAACADKVASPPPVGEGTYIDFAHVKAQTTCSPASTRAVASRAT